MAITSVKFLYNGSTYTLTYNSSTGKYQGSFTAPGATSWFEEDHTYKGTVEATNRDDLGTVNTTSESAAFRVVETGKPVISVLDPPDLWIVPTLTPTVRWVVYDASSGVNPDTIALKIDGTAVSGIEITAQGAGGYACEWSGNVTEGEHTLAFDVKDYDGNAAATVSEDIAVLLFITDRTQEDVDRVRYLQTAVRAGTATDEELAEWAENLKGAYNASDMNRVGLGAYYVNRLMTRYGYAADVTAKRDWNDAILGPIRTQGARYIADIQNIRNALPMYDTTPPCPSTARYLNYQGANNIEQILIDSFDVLTKVAPAWLVAGDEVVAGEL